jgi:hypothetical protein
LLLVAQTSRTATTAAGRRDAQCGGAIAVAALQTERAIPGSPRASSANRHGVALCDHGGASGAQTTSAAAAGEVRATTTTTGCDEILDLTAAAERERAAGIENERAPLDAVRRVIHRRDGVAAAVDSRGGGRCRCAEKSDLACEH